MRLTHDAQVMPSMGRATSMGGRRWTVGVAAILPGSIADAVAVAPPGHTSDRCRRSPSRPVARPWGPLHVAATERGVVAAEWRMTRRGVRGGARHAGSAPGRRRSRRWPGDPGGAPPRRARADRRRDLPVGRRPTVAARPRGPAGLGPARPARGRATPVGPDRELRRDRPADRARRGRRGRSVGPSAATRSRCSSRAIGSSPRTARIGGYGGDAWGSRGRARAQARAAAARGRHGGRPRRLDSAATDRRNGRRRSAVGGVDDRRGRPGPVHVRRLPPARLLAALARPARLDGRLVADRPRRRDLRLSRDRVRPRGRPDADGHGDPEPRRRPARRRLRRPPRSQEDHDRDLPDPGGARGAASRSWSGSTPSRSRACTSCSCSTPASSSSSIPPTTA